MTERDFLLMPDSHRRPIHAIMAEVCAKHRIRPAELLSPRRNKAFVLARHEAMYLAHRVCGYSFPQIGIAMNRDHSTVIHAVRAHEKRMALKRFQREQLGRDYLSPSTCAAVLPSSDSSQTVSA